MKPTQLVAVVVLRLITLIFAFILDLCWLDPQNPVWSKRKKVHAL